MESPSRRFIIGATLPNKPHTLRIRPRVVFLFCNTSTLG